MSCVTCHLSPVTWHLSLSPVTCHLLPYICHLSLVTCHLSPVSVTCHLSRLTGWAGSFQKTKTYGFQGDYGCKSETATVNQLRLLIFLNQSCNLDVL